MSGRPWADGVLAQTAPPSITRASSQSLVDLIAILLCCPNDCSLRPAPRQSGRPRLSCAATEDSIMMLSARAGAFKDIPGAATAPIHRVALDFHHEILSDVRCTRLSAPPALLTLLPRAFRHERALRAGRARPSRGRRSAQRRFAAPLRSR